MALFLAGPITAQQGTISGRVLDSATQQPLEGAEVSGGGSQRLTNNQGSFTLNVGAGNHTVIVRFLGHQTGSQVVSVAAGATVTVQFALNAPKNKASLGLRYDDKARGFFYGARAWSRSSP